MDKEIDDTLNDKCFPPVGFPQVCSGEWWSLLERKFSDDLKKNCRIYIYVERAYLFIVKIKINNRM